ncbi:MAG TPA: hypothetical protein VGZ93_07890 [Candidatus Methylacidiphilales bacterium]|jgi:hypothetical protein|nr:hypothetical protein [Candidatus Methylacidiphilales bacterium]
MNTSDNHKALTPLVGLPLSSIGRAANMLWLNFGEMREVPWGTATRIIGDWAIHVQCTWRLYRRDRIFITSRDYYRSPDGTALGDDWDTFGKSKFDSVARFLCSEFETNPSIVESVDCDEAGGFLIHFDDEVRLQVSPDIGVSGEQWRLFQPGEANKHFVVGNALPK